MRLFAPVVLATLVAAPALAEDLVFTLVNNSSLSIVEIYMSPADEELWGENILTVDELAPGTEGEVLIADGLDVCDYDLSFITEDGAETEDTQNLCELGTYTLTD
jgi:hypothetical protein